LFYAKMAAAVPSKDELKAILPTFIPDLASVFMEVVEQPLLKKALGAVAKQEWADAIHWFGQELELNPANREGYTGYAHCLMALARFREALDVLRSGAHAVPEDAEIQALLSVTLAALGEFEGARECHIYATKLAPNDLALSALALTDGFASPNASAAELAAKCAAWMDKFGVKSDFSSSRPAEQKDRLTIGYVVGSFGRREGSQPLSNILAHRSADRFQTVGFGLGNLTDQSNTQMQKAFDIWHDVGGMDAVTLGALVDAEDVDILVDVGGFTCPELVVAFADRIAPVQVSWIGSPFGSGSDNVDARLSDKYVEQGTDGSIYKEKVVHGDLINLLLVEPKPRSSIEVERQESVMTYGVDATFRELTSESIRVWASVLHENPESMLALRDHDFKNHENLVRLMSLFGNFGLAHRIDLISSDDDAEFFGNIDVLLVPMAGSRPELPINAINYGVPVVCMAGSNVPSRMSSLAIKGIGGADNVVAETEADYIEYAKYWTVDAGARKQFAEKMAGNVADTPLFNFKARSKVLEDIFDGLWNEACAKA